jgi:hypothetical protein
MRLCTTSLGPLASVDTLSHTSMIAPQSSEVRFSSVARAVSQQQSAWKLSFSRSAALQVKLAKPTSRYRRGRNRVVAHRLTRRMAPRPLLGTLQAMQCVQPLLRIAVVL